LTDFAELGLVKPLLEALKTSGYTTPTPIQSQAIPPVLAGRDLLGIAQTGTGKTAAFALPILQRLAAKPQAPRRRSCRALILSPTRELASQIHASFTSYGRHLGLSAMTVFGGVGMHDQIRRLARGVDIVVATPGRLIDHLDRGTLTLDTVEIVVLDEADQMLDLGFIHAIRRLARVLPKQRQNLFFSATMPEAIGSLAADFLVDPVEVMVAPVATTVDRVDQRILFVEHNGKRDVLCDILRAGDVSRALVFTRTKHGADKVARHLALAGIGASAIHGNKTQGQRERALAGFRSGRHPVLVATDIAARGIDVAGVTHVVNFDLPNVAESYVHRIGRTARAGADGIAISLCAADERAHLRGIERLIRRRLPVIGPDGKVTEPPAEVRPARAAHKGPRQGRNGQGRERDGSFTPRRHQRGRPQSGHGAGRQALSTPAARG
jgi:ATP-dependent RNA helicase RhlE